MRGRPRGNGGAPIQCFSMQRLEIWPILRCFDVSGFYAISYSLTPPRSSVLLEISTKSRRRGQPNPSRFPGPRRFGGIVSAFLTLRCPVGTLLLGSRKPGRGAVRAKTATREPGTSPCSVSRCPISRCFDASEFYAISYSLIPCAARYFSGFRDFDEKLNVGDNRLPGGARAAPFRRRRQRFLRSPMPR